MEHSVFNGHDTETGNQALTKTGKTYIYLFAEV